MNDVTSRQLWKSEKEDIWKECLENYWTFVKGNLRQNYELEREMDVLTPQKLESLDSKAWFTFLEEKYFRWKYTQPNRYATTIKELKRYAEENRLDELFSIKERLLNLDLENIKGSLKTACEIHGLGIAGASGLLSLLYPKAFGTVDQFVVKALLKVPDIPETPTLERMKPSGLSLINGVFLIEMMRRKAEELNAAFGTDFWTPRKIDMILWISRD